MDHPSNSIEEATESVNPGDQGLLASDPFESNAPVELHEALLRTSQDMASVLERLAALKAPIDMVRRHGLRNSMGIAQLVVGTTSNGYLSSWSQVRAHGGERNPCEWDHPSSEWARGWGPYKKRKSSIKRNYG